MTRLRGLVPPICTPLDDDGLVDERSLARLIEYQLAAGVDGIFVLGSSGEAVYLDDPQRRRVLEVARSAVSGAVPLLVGALEATTARVIDQVRMLEGNGVDAWVVTAPFYANCSPAEVTEHFRRIAGAAGHPVLAYDIPGNVGRRLDLDVSAQLLQERTIAGLKDSSGTLEDFSVLLGRTGQDRTVSLLTGVDAKASEALDLGADGLIPGLANVRPGYFVELLRAHGAGDRRRASAYQDAITGLTALFGIGLRHGVGRHASELGGLKAVLNQEGVIATTAVSPPMSRYPQAARLEALELLAAIDSALEAALHLTPSDYSREPGHD